jgi:hypothetical protein
MPFRKKVLYLIFISTAIRLLIAGIIELGNDEVYYYTYAQHLQWNYFDHPPGVALLIRLTTFNLKFIDEVFIRLGPILCAAIGTWLSYRIGSFIRNERTGWYAALLYNTSIYSSIIAGIFILPDSPQVIFWLAGMFVLLRMIRKFTDQKKVSTKQWLLFGLLTGICILCKVHGIFLWGGFGLYILFYKRKILLQPQLYLSFLLTLLVISPIVWWNINNNFITWTFHSGRVAVHEVSIDTMSFFQTIFGQLLYNNPINVVLIIISILFYKRKPFLEVDMCRILLLLGLPIIITVTGISLFNDVLPHWSGPGFLSLSFIAAAYVDSVKVESLQKLPPVLRSSLALIVIVVVAGVSLIKFYPGTLSSKKDEIGGGDFTLDLYGWRNFGKEFNNWLDQPEHSGYRDMKIVCNKWFPAAHIEYYVARPKHTHVLGVGSLYDIHQFAWLNKFRSGLKEGDDAICIVPSNYPTDVATSYQNTFSDFIILSTFPEKRNGKICRLFTVYLLKDYKGEYEIQKTVVR